MSARRETCRCPDPAWVTSESGLTFCERCMREAPPDAAAVMAAEAILEDAGLGASMEGATVWVAPPGSDEFAEIGRVTHADVRHARPRYPRPRAWTWGELAVNAVVFAMVVAWAAITATLVIEALS